MPETTPLRASCSAVYHGIQTEHGTHTNLFRAVFDQSAICMASIDRTFRVNEVNSAFSKQFGRRAEDICGHGFQELLHPGIQTRVRRQFDGLADGHRSRFVSHIVGLQPRDSVFPAELTVIAVHGADSRIDSAIALVKPDEEEGESPMLPGQAKILSALDARILESVASGVSTIDIATKLYLSRQGVEYHVTSLLRRLKAPNRAALVSRAYSIGLLSVGSWPPRVLPDCVR